MFHSVEILYGIVHLIGPIADILVQNALYKVIRYGQDLFLFRIAKGVFPPGLPVKSGLTPPALTANAFAKGFCELRQLCMRMQQEVEG